MIKRKEIIVRLFLFFILLIIGLFDLNKYFGPTTGVDDIGYWTEAYYFAYGESKNVASELSYYSFGYSLLLAPLVRIVKNGTYLYRSIIVLNTFLNSFSFLVLAKISDYTLRMISNRWRSILSFVAIMYVSNYTYSKIILSESFVTFLFLVILLLMIIMLEEYSLSKLLLTSIVCVFLHYVHQRTIAVLFAYVFIILILCVKRVIPVKDTIICVSICAALMVGGFCIKKEIIEIVYKGNSLVETNDYSYRVSSAMHALRFQNLLYLFLSLNGKVFYFMFSTCLLGGLGLMAYIRESLVITSHSDNNLKTSEYVAVFLVVTVFITILISAVACYGPLTERFEIAVYGRYMEHVYSPFLLKGLYQIKIANDRIKYDVIVALVLSLIGLACLRYQFIVDSPPSTDAWLSPATYRLLSNTTDYAGRTILIAKLLFLFCFLIILSTVRLGFFHSSRGIVAISMMCIIFWGINAKGLSNAYIFQQNALRLEEKEMIDIINNNNLQVDCYADSYYSKLRVREIQFMCSGKNFELKEEKDIVNGWKDSQKRSYLVENGTDAEKALWENVDSWENIIQNDRFVYAY